MNNVKNKNQNGFTLMELLTVVAIVGVLSTIAFSNFQEYHEKAKKAVVASDLSSIRLAVITLEGDTGLSPGGIPLSPCVQNPEILINDCGAGLVCNDGTFSNWAGPYLTINTTDPWGNLYRFDPDYDCSYNQYGCLEGVGWVRAVVSAGPDEAFNYDPDEAVMIICDGER